jgi:hypothetical protein
MTTRHVYYVPAELANLAGEQEVSQLLAEVREKLMIPFEIHTIHQGDEMEKLKSALLPLSVQNRLRLHQTARTKTLYSHLLIVEGNTPVAFFPQIRREKERKLVVDVMQYLRSLLAGSFESITPIPSIEQKVPRKEKVDEELLKEGYIKSSKELKRMSKEWSSAETPWPK